MSFQSKSIETQSVYTYEQIKIRQAVACVGWRSLNEEELPPDSEAPPRSGWTERSVQTQMEKSGRSLKEDNSTQWGFREGQSKQNDNLE